MRAVAVSAVEEGAQGVDSQIVTLTLDNLMEDVPAL
jgi:hypothetical protein